MVFLLWVKCRFNFKLPKSSIAIMQLLLFKMEALHDGRSIRHYTAPFIPPQDEVVFHALAFQMLKS